VGEVLWHGMSGLCRNISDFRVSDSLPHALSQSQYPPLSLFLPLSMPPNILAYALFPCIPRIFLASGFCLMLSLQVLSIAYS
jgi:hypothetical protein